MGTNTPEAQWDSRNQQVQDSWDAKYRVETIHGPDWKAMQVHVPRDMAIRNEIGDIIQWWFW